ncbi:MAG: hypothetical protein ACTHN0_06875 [Aquihabitans sp.]
MSDPTNTLARHRRRRRITVAPVLAPAAVIILIASIAGTIAAVVYRLVEAWT